MLDYLPTFLTIILPILYYFLYLKPQKIISKYVKAFEEKGYRVYHYPYRPWGFPLLQAMFKNSERGDAFFAERELWADYDVVIGNMFSSPAISFLSPQARKQFARNQNQYMYIKVPTITQLQIRLIGRGIIFSQGMEWKRKRKVLSSLFTYQFISQNIEDIQKICQNALEELQNDSNKNNKQIQQNTYEYNLLQLTSKMFSDIILSLFLGIDSTHQRIQGKRICTFMIELVNDANQQMNKLLPMVFGAKFLDLGLTEMDRSVNRRMKIFNQWALSYCQKILTQTKNSNENTKTILQLLIKSSLKQEQYSKEQLISQLKTFFIAGTDTTSHFLQMLIYYIGKNKQIQEKLRKQINQNILDGKCSLQNLKNLKYMEAVQKQTTRMYGPVNLCIPRVVVKDHYFDGIPIFKGTVVQYNAISTHLNQKFYKDPKIFRPERWLDQNQVYKDSSLLVGFGMGSRNCIGQVLAKIQSKIGLVKFLSRYSEIKTPQDDIPVRWKFLYVPDEFSVKVKI